MRGVWRHRADRRGGVAVNLALTAVPAIFILGATIDITQAVTLREKMQDALDAATLMASQKAAGETQTALNAAVSSAFTGELTSANLSGVSVAATYSAASGVSTLNTTATGTYTTPFAGLIGMDNMTMTVTSNVKWGGSRLRVALVLDNTGSMAQSGKITALKSATNSLLTQLQGMVANPGDVYVSITPFSKDINVGSANAAATWLDWTDWNAANGSCTGGGHYGGASQSTCSGVWTPASHSTWNGCVMDRGENSAPDTANDDANVNAVVAGQASTLFPAEQYSNCPQAGVGLTYDWTALQSVVNAMSPNGSTNQTIGLAHGWMTLVGGGPYPAPPAMDPNYTYHQVIILLSDGLNTQDRWYGNGSNTSTQVDARMNLACTNAKAAGIIIYTVQVNTSGDPTSTVLQNCATSASYFYQVTASASINAVFQQIGVGLSNLRVAG